MKPGIYFDLDRQSYDAIDALNASTLVHALKSWAHFRHAELHGRPDTKSMAKGRAAHVLTLEPHTFDAAYVVYDGQRKGRAWETFKEANAGREILTTSEYAACAAIAEAARAHSEMASMLETATGKPEVSLVWERGGFLCKGRLDWLQMDSRVILDLKVTKDASPRGFARECATYATAMKAAWYLDAMETHDPSGEFCEWDFWLLAVEPTAPHVTQLYRVPESALEAGRKQYTRLLEELQMRRMFDTWPGYADGMLDLELPGRAVPVETVDEFNEEEVANG
jgi:hypothetical protein